MTPPEPSEIEAEARRLRDLAYGKASTDNNWDGSREHWLKDMDWLRVHSKAQPRGDKNG